MNALRRRLSQLSKTILGPRLATTLLWTAKRFGAPFHWTGLLPSRSPHIPGLAHPVRNATIDDELETELHTRLGNLARMRESCLPDTPWVIDYLTQALPRMSATVSLAKDWRGRHGLDVGIAFGLMDIVLRDRYGLEIAGTELPEIIPLYCPWVVAQGIHVSSWRLGRETPPYPPSSQDFILLAEVLEHLKISPHRTLELLTSLLRPGGQLLLTTPNIASFGNIAKLTTGQNILEPFRGDLAVDQDPTDYVIHVREYTISEVVALVQGVGLGVEEVVMCSWGQRHFVPHPYLNDIICLLATKPR